MSTRVLIADDHALVRAGVVRLLGELDCEVVAEAATGEEAVTAAREQQPDVALLDIHMPGIGGLEASQRILRFCPTTRIVILTVQGGGPLPRTLLDLGVDGFLTKGCAFEEMSAALAAVQRGERYVSHDVAQRLALDGAAGDEGNPFDRLAARELQVALMLIAGEANRAIAEALSLSPKTVTTYRQRILEKVGASNQTELLRLAIRHDLTSTGSIE